VGVKRLIITADDFGLSEGVNDAVVEAHRAGTLTSASLMTNFDGFQHAVDALARAAELDVGLHFVLSAGDCISPIHSVSTLVDHRGKFHSRRSLLARAVTGRVRRDDVERELSAQLEVLQKAGVTPTFINGDQHIHVLPVVRDVVVACAAKLGIAARVPNETTVWMPSGAAPRSWATLGARLATKTVLGRLASAFARLCRDAGVATNRAFISPFGIVPTARFDPHAFVRVLDGLVDGLNEMMVHPAYPDDASARFWTGGQRQAIDRKVELESLLAPSFAEAVRAPDVQLVTYAQPGESTS
jgi:predicted glycoside hydrolase/deacetylase ChbG (UPF0249 family)